MNIYELYGRLAEERRAEHDAHVRTVAVLRGVLDGTIPATSIVVTGDTWTTVPPKPAEVAQ